MSTSPILFEFGGRSVTQEEYCKSPRPTRDEVICFLEVLGLSGMSLLPILQILSIAAGVTPHVRLKCLLAFVYQAISGGADVYPALSTFNEREPMFTASELEFIRCGESQGALFEAFLLVSRERHSTPLALAFDLDAKGAEYAFLRQLGINLRLRREVQNAAARMEYDERRVEPMNIFAETQEEPCDDLLRLTCEQAAPSLHKVLNDYLISHPDGTPLAVFFLENRQLFGKAFFQFAAAVHASDNPIFHPFPCVCAAFGD